MKIAVSAKGTSVDSEVDPRFGRTIGFILFDTETGSSTYLDNSAHRDLSQGSGIQTAQMIVKAGAEVLISGQIGPKADQVLSHTEIKSYVCTSGTVKEAIQALENNELKERSVDKVQSGPGKMGGRGMGGGKRGRGPSQGGQGMGGGARGRGPK
jgi:predicted Fe-Mo cluster-binding NifX family protein